MLEIELLKALRKDSQLSLDVSQMSLIDVDQFYGVEIGEFPVRIAEVALWMMDRIMNNRLSLEFGESYVRIPLKKSPHIRHADALEIEWSEVIQPNECTYILGNPPFGGANYQSSTQREQVRRTAQLGGSGGTLDFVTAWFIKAGIYLQESQATIGFVATSSITQGEQVAQALASPCLIVTVSKLLSRIERLHGGAMLAGWLMYTSSLSACADVIRNPP